MSTACWMALLQTVPQDESPLDTVGAICLDARGGVGGGVSSGGISLKFPGRVGQAAVFGCGCWAETSPSKHSRAIACSTSGTMSDLIPQVLVPRVCFLQALANI